jgi:hypothetical protein
MYRNIRCFFVLFQNDVHVNIGGGRDNIIRQNIFYNTLEYSMQIDSRGKGGGSNGNELLKKLHVCVLYNI